jgi:hypothetical protein
VLATPLPMSPIFLFLRDVCAAVPGGRTTNLATHPPLCKVYPIKLRNYYERNYMHKCKKHFRHLLLLTSTKNVCSQLNIFRNMFV